MVANKIVSRVIRRARVADTHAVFSAILSAKDEIPLKRFDTDEHREWVRTRCRNRQVWIAEVDGELAGVMVMNVAEIFYLVTLASHRRCGVGRALVRHAVETIKRQFRSGVTAKVKQENAPMIALLTTEGFKLHRILSALPGWDVYFVGQVT